jgi:hypothetical protein
MPENIDFAFLSGLEGGCKTTGYVPASSVSQSGVTIATGFDLGQRTEADLTRLGVCSEGSACRRHRSKWSRRLAGLAY